MVILRLRSLGDCVLSTPAIALLKRHRPDLIIGVAVEPRFAAVYSNNPDVGAVFDPTARAVRTFDARLCLNLHGGTRSARLTLLSGSRFRAGFDIFKPGWIYNTPIPTAQVTLGITRRVHTAEHQASAMFHLGVPISDVPRASLYPPDGRSSFAPAGEFAVVHPFASAPDKTWPADSFRALGDELRLRGLEPVFVGSAADDLSVFSGFRVVAGATLTELAPLLRDASLFVGNDSGPAHMAAAFGVPEVIFFGTSDVEIWSPWRTRSRVLQANRIEQIDCEEAVRAVDQLMREAVA